MAKLPNLIEKKRSFLKTAGFVFRQVYIASPRITVTRYVIAFITAGTSFVEFGALAAIVNEFVKNGISGVHTAILAKYVIIIVLSDFIPDALQFISNALQNIQEQTIQRHLTGLQTQSVERIDIGTLEQSEYQDMLNTVTMRGVGAVTSIFNWSTNLVQYFFQILIASISLAVIAPIVLIVTLVGVIPTYIFQRREALQSVKLWSLQAEERRSWTIKLSYLLQKYPLIQLKNFNAAALFRKQALAVMKIFHDKVNVLYENTAYANVFSKAILSVSVCASVILLLLNVTTGTLAVGSLVFAYTVLFKFQTATTQSMRSIGRLAEHLKFTNLLMDLLEVEPLIISGTKILEEKIISISFENISFTYPGTEKPVINNISVTLTNGSHTAIVGLNGAGKTTFVKLLMRIYDPTAGAILINGVNLREIDLAWWSSQLSVMMQDFIVFNEETIAGNVALGDTEKIDFEKIHHATTQATADTFIEKLANKYDQKIGTEFRGGVELSRGQNQKLALARTFYREAPIMILDEPTAAVDAVSEDTIFKNLLVNKNENNILVIISHKFSNVREADKIVLIRDGTIFEEGNHKELMKKKGEYARLFNLQAEGYK